MVFFSTSKSFILKQTLPVESIFIFLCIIKWKRLLEKNHLKKQKRYTKSLRPFLEKCNIMIRLRLLEIIIAIWKWKISYPKDHLVGSRGPWEWAFYMCYPGLQIKSAIQISTQNPLKGCYFLHAF